MIAPEWRGWRQEAIESHLGRRAALELGISLATSLLLGLLLVLSGAETALVLLGIPFAVVIAFRYPEYVILLMLALALGVLPTTFNPYFRLAGRGVFMTDMVLVLLLAVAVIRPLSRTPYHWVKTPLDGPLYLFAAFVIVSMVTAVTRSGVSFSDTTYEARILLYYLLFFAVTNLVRTAGQLRRLIRGLYVISIAVAVLMLAQPLLGISLWLVGQTLRSEQGMVRVFHPGTVAVMAILMAQVCAMIMRRDRPSLPPGGTSPLPARRDLRLGALQVPRVLLLIVLSLSLLITLGRNLLISSAIGLLVLMVVLRKGNEQRLVGRAFEIAGVAGLVGVVLALTGNADRILAYLQALLSRMSQIVSSETDLTSTLAWRLREMQYAWQHILASPFLGIGLYAPYRPSFYPGDPLVRYLHNAYLSLWLKTGLPGLLIFGWLSLLFLWRGLRHWREVTAAPVRAVVLGFTAAYVAALVSNMVAPFFVQDLGVTFFAVMMGVNEVALRLAHETTPPVKGSA